MDRIAAQGASIPVATVNPVIVVLIAEAIRRYAPDVPVDDIVSADFLALSQVSTLHKQTLLQRAFDHGGGALLLRLGQIFHEPSLPPHPLLLMFRNAETVDDLLHKVKLLRSFMHATHHLAVVSRGPRRVVLDHLDQVNEPTAHLEALWTCGLLAAGFSHIGCAQVVVRLPLVDETLRVIDDGVVCDPLTTVNTHRFDFRWTRQEPQPRVAGLDEYLLGTANLQPLHAESSLSEQVVHLIRGHLDRRWTVARVAARLGTTPRSLQRELASEGTSYRQLLRDTRIEVAQNLLLNPSLSITEVGIVTGYSDAGHFSRRFRDATGLTPSAWREERLPRS